MKKNMTKQRGITLIALVITIIVLLILAGVSIAMLTGSNGILTRAQEAKEKTQIASVEEQKKLAQTEASMNIEKKEFIDKYGNKIMIPAYCEILETETEVIAENGIVIIDKNGNEYVWIPVTKNEDGTPTNPYITTQGKLKTENGEIEIQLGRYEFDNDTALERAYSGSNIEGNISDFKESVQKYGGYYIGRYEAGIENGILSSTDNSENISNWTGYSGQNMKIVSKEGIQVWNYITQEMAMELCEKFKQDNGYTDLSSNLINSYAWDTTILFIQKAGKEDNSSRYSLEIGKSLNENNISKTGQALLRKTGRKDIQCNIYDLATNGLEWTTEISSNSNVVFRGGVYNGTNSYVSGRYSTQRHSADISTAFRIILYLN